MPQSESARFGPLANPITQYPVANSHQTCFLPFCLDWRERRINKLNQPEP